MRKVIIIHHVQEMWCSGLRKYGTDFETEIQKVTEHLDDVSYDRIIVTNFEAGFGLDEEQISFLSHHFPEVYDYMYGWEKGDLDGCKFADGGSHSEIVLISDWMEEIKDDEVYLCGAFDGECIEDMEIALSSLNINVNRIESLIN